jgi:DNA polymerase-3 subunit gamma/tau
MNTTALTIKYRPQTFADVVGQETLRAILSRASSESRVAPAYLFSGTRGVGKTTMARIFAKALNCRAAPAAEPCNRCDQCKAVTAGAAVDVVEIDGASNRGIDDVRRLKEVIGYAPMEGRYKIFIIDEAHMLSREAFNALLKTLEEPPPKVSFIMATTEPHKVPSTIVSRCQHYVFRPLPENALISHLADVLDREGTAYEENAVRLIARRGAGSVRDAMSLLGQVLALGAGALTETSAREVLGLAGQEAFPRLIAAFQKNDALSVSVTLREMLDQGLDMGFFLRELASLWRNLFILRQCGEAGLPVVELPENEARLCLEMSRGFSLQHIHACWQMTLEGQRRVLSSLEPALGLELLLLNLAILPQLLSLEKLSALGRRGGQPEGAGRETFAASDGAGKRGEPESDTVLSGGAGAEAPGDILPFAVEQPRPPAAFSGSQGEPRNDVPENFSPPPDNRTGESGAPASARADGEETPDDAAIPAPPARDKEWRTLFSLADSLDLPAWLMPLLRHTEADWQEDVLTLTVQDSFSAERLREPHARAALDRLLSLWLGAVPLLEIRVRGEARKSREELRAEILRHALVREMQTLFGAKIIDYGQIR